MWEARKEHVSQYFGIDQSKIDVHDTIIHIQLMVIALHLCIKKPFLVFTIDGGGDNINATVSICNVNGEIKEKADLLIAMEKNIEQ